MADAKFDVNVREVLGTGSGVTPKHEGPLRRPVEAIIDKREERGIVGEPPAEEAPMVNAGFLKQTKDKNKASF